MDQSADSQTRRREIRSALVLLVLLSLGLVQTGCRAMWDAQRENERIFALDNARVHSGRGQCDRALGEFDRAQARIDLGPLAREATLARARCYDKLGFAEVARAHRRLIDDFYTTEPMAYPSPNGASKFQVQGISVSDYESPPSWLEIAPPKYTPYARRSKIVGKVVVSFEIAGNQRPRKIRVLAMPHPLLATWAIEAIANAESKKKPETPDVIPGTQFITTFSFQYRFAPQSPS